VHAGTCDGVVDDDHVGVLENASRVDRDHRRGVPEDDGPAGSEVLGAGRDGIGHEFLLVEQFSKGVRQCTAMVKY
jgi:hypothetical protein